MAQYGRRRGLSLLELLVVVVVVAVFLAILLPALTSPPASSPERRCLMNMRTIGQASAAYMSEFDGYLVRGYQPGAGLEVMPFEALFIYMNSTMYYMDEESMGEYAPEPLAPLIGQVEQRDKLLAGYFAQMSSLQCPAFPARPEPGEAGYDPQGHRPFHTPDPFGTGEPVHVDQQAVDYVTNAYPFKLAPLRPGREMVGMSDIDLLETPAHYVFATEANSGLPLNRLDRHQLYEDDHLWNGVDVPARRMIDDQRHKGMTHMSFLDGRGLAMKITDVDRARFTDIE